MCAITGQSAPENLPGPVPWCADAARVLEGRSLQGCALSRVPGPACRAPTAPGRPEVQGPSRLLGQLRAGQRGDGARREDAGDARTHARSHATSLPFSQRGGARADCWAPGRRSGRQREWRRPAPWGSVLVTRRLCCYSRSKAPQSPSVRWKTSPRTFCVSVTARGRTEPVTSCPAPGPAGVTAAPHSARGFQVSCWRHQPRGADSSAQARDGGCPGVTPGRGATGEGRLSR